MTKDGGGKREETEIKREADQFQSSPLMQKQCAALSTAFSRNCSINKLSQSVPTALCVSVWRCMCIFCVFLNLCVVNFSMILVSCVSQCWYMWCTSNVALGSMCLWHKDDCLSMFSEFDCYTLRRCVYKSLQGHTVITLCGECFLHHDYTCSDNKSSSYS